MKFFVKNIDGVTIRLLFGLSMLILLSLIFWKQRVFVLDAAFQSFSIVAAKDYAFQVQRYGAVLVQSVPVLFAKLGLPLKVILAGYSLSFTIYPVLFFGYLLLLKEKKYAWSLALFYLVLTYHTFFWIQSELIQSASLAILCIGTLSSKVLNKYLKLLLVASLLLLCIYTHPLAIVSLMYLSAYQYFDLREHEKEDEEKRRPFVVLTILSLVTFVVKQFIIGTGKYDETAVASAQNVFVHIWNFFDLPSWHRFITHILENYHFIPILFFYITYKFVKKKKYIKLAMVWLGVWAWLILILTTTYYATEQFYIESYYLIVGYMLVIPFVVDLFHTMSTKVQNRLITFLIVYRLVVCQSLIFG